MNTQRTVIVTGASSGIGAAIASTLAQSGWRVFGTMRRPDPVKHGADALSLDVTSDASVEATVAEVLKHAGRIDAIVNNAGIDMLGAIEETTADEALALFQTNFFGVHRLIRAVLPIMRAQKSGRIITIGSIAGFLPTPFEAFYSASKHALEGYSESLDYEIRPFGIRTILIEPGFIRTSLRGNLVRTATSLDVYQTKREKAGSGFDKGVGAGIEPLRVAQVVERALNDTRPKLRQRVGNDANQLAMIRRYLPGFVFKIGMQSRF